MAGTKASGNRGGSRGRPVLVRYTISRPAAIWLRVCTQSRLGRTEVTREEITETLEQVLLDAARRQEVPTPGDQE